MLILGAAATLSPLACRRGPPARADAAVAQPATRRSPKPTNEAKDASLSFAERVFAAQFRASPDLAAEAATFARGAVDTARNTYAVDLDWSDGSIARVESILDRIHREHARTKPSVDEFDRIRRSFGSYIGEVFRRNHGATWGMIETGQDVPAPGLQSRAGQRFWPWGRVERRLLNGAEDDVADYYSALVANESDASR